MKKFLRIAAIVAAMAMILTGCPPDGGEDGGEKSSNTTLSSIKIGDLDPVTTGGANSANTVNDISTKIFDPESKKINLTDATKNGADGNGALVTLNFHKDFKGVAKIVILDENTSLTEGALADYNADKKPVKKFEDGDKLFVKMTAENGTDVKYYGVEVYIGRDADLKEISIGTDKLTETDGFGTAYVNDAGLTALKAETEVDKFGKKNIQKKPGSFAVTAKGPEDAREIKISRNGTDWDDSGTSINFSNSDEDLYVKIVSNNGKKTNYYRIQVFFLKNTAITYGKPTAWDIANSTPDAIDTAFGGSSNEWLYINRWNTFEGDQGWKEQEAKDRSFGRAKLLWDADGVWIYAQVWEGHVSAEGAAADGASEHLKSSVELFINEAYESVKSGSVTGNDRFGGQYRLGAHGERSGPTEGQKAAFNALNESSAKIYGAGEMVAAPAGITTSLTSGYIVVFHAPWIAADAYPLKDNKLISIEIQINAMDNTGATRAGVINWNNASSSSYSKLDYYGEATLDLGNNTLPAQRAKISKQPADIKVAQNASISKSFTVEATSTDGGTLTFEWFKSDSATNFGTTGVTSMGAGSTTSTGDPLVYTSTYQPSGSTATTGSTYYFVVVTNKKTVDGTDTTKTANSSMARVWVVDTSVNPLDIELLTAAKTYVSPSDGADKWGEGAAVNEASDLVIPTGWNPSKFQKIVVTYVGYKDKDGTILNTKPASQYTGDFFAELYNGTTSAATFGNNANRISGDNTTASPMVFEFDIPSSLTAAFESGGRLDLKIKAGQYSNGDTLRRLDIQSVLLVGK